MIKIAESQTDFFSLMRVRATVFMIEQKVEPSLELDESDDTAVHFIYEHEGEVVATARVIYEDNHYKIGRVCVLKEVRHLKIGSQLMHYIHDYLIKQGIPEVHLGAQMSAMPFYLSLGYIPYGAVFLDANIDHQMAVKMLID